MDNKEEYYKDLLIKLLFMINIDKDGSYFICEENKKFINNLLKEFEDDFIQS